MKILIMCGGQGTRLRSVAKSLPKPLIKIADKTILEIKMEQYLRQGFEEFILCTGYKGDLVRNTVLQFNTNAQIDFSDAGIEAGILKRLYSARELFGDSVIMTYGDTFTDIDLDDLINTHTESDNEATIVVAPIKNPFGLVDFDKDNKITYFAEKPTLNYYIGYAIVNKSAFEFIPPKVIDMPDGEGLVTFYKILIALNKLGVYYHPGLQVTFNTPEELEKARNTIDRFYTARDS